MRSRYYRYTSSNAPNTALMEVTEDGECYWCSADRTRGDKSTLRAEMVTDHEWFVLVEDDKTEEQQTMSETAEAKAVEKTIPITAAGWKVGDSVRWMAPPVDAREWGEVTEILGRDSAKQAGFPDGYGVKVKWDIGKVEAYYVSEDGRIFAPSIKDIKKGAPESATLGFRKEQKVEGLEIRKRDKPKDVDIVREGTQIILPPGMSFDEGITWLTRKKEADEKEVAIYEIVDAIPLEGAYAFKRALDRVYGFTALVNTPGMFGSNPPVMVGVEVGHGKTEQVPWGRLSVPGIAGYFETGITQKDGQFKFCIQGKTKQKHKEAVSKLAELTRTIARDESIYKGKAIRVTFPTQEQVEEGSVSPRDHQPKFLNLDHVVESDLIFPERVAKLVQTAIFNPIEKRERCQAEGVPFKRGILLEGPWGVGKTLTADVTAKKAVRHNITFIYLDDVKNLEQALRFANLYAPAVVFAEDIDQVGKDDRHDDESPLNTILNTLDGVDMKNAEIMAVLTTNYINDIEQGLLRPGRIDAVIPVRPPDAAAATRLVQLYSRGRLAEGVDLTAVGVKLNGMIPAVIREVVERAKLEAIGRLEEDQALVLTAGDLDAAADSMLSHLELLKPRTKDERSERERAAGILADAIKTNPRLRLVESELTASVN